MAFRFLLFSILLSALVSCGQKDASSLNGWGQPTADPNVEFLQQNALQIIDESGQPIAAAEILIGQSENNPFSGNFMRVDHEGMVIVPPAWTDPQPVTITAQGYVRATFYGRTPGPQQFQLRKAPSTARLEIRGQTTQFGKLKKDGIVDVGLVLAAMPRRSFANFDLMSIVSPETDRISIIGNKIDIPSNFTLPEQKESYFLPITLKKPNYRIYMPQPGSYRVAAAHARFPLDDVIDEVRSGKSIFDAVNFFEFRGLGIHDVVLGSEGVVQDIPVNEYSLRPQVSLAAPQFDREHMMLTIPMFDIGGVFIPTDIKQMKPNETRKLAFPAEQNRGIILSVLRRADTSSELTGAQQEFMSAVFTPVNQSQAVEFLPLPQAPELRNDTLVMYPPTAPAKVDPAATYAVLSEVELAQSGQLEYEIKKSHWELYAADWRSDLQLPAWPAEGAPYEQQNDKHWRWEVLFVGGQGLSATVGPEVLENASHVTSSAIDL